jgi:hypothetical protein
MKSGACFFHDSTFPMIIRHPLKAEIRVSLRRDNSMKGWQAEIKKALTGLPVNACFNW